MTESADSALEEERDELFLQVLDEIAGREGCDILDLPVLHGTIDTDAVDRLIESLEEGQIAFTYEGYRVIITAKREISVTEAV